MRSIRERFGILIRPTGRFETVQLGSDRGKRTIAEVIEEHFGCPFDKARTFDGYAYLTRRGAFEDGCIKNAPAEWFSNTPLYGDVIIVPISKGETKHYMYWERPDAYRKMVWMQIQWGLECDRRVNPERYSFKNKKNTARE